MRGIVGLGIVMVVVGLLVAGVGCTSQGDGGGTQTPHAAAPAPAAAADDYPLDTCVVSGEKLGGMGAPHVITHEGRTVKFCCAGCVKDFQKDPAKYLAKIDAAKKK